MAFIMGYTGEVGKALVKELNRQKVFTKVVLVGRRVVELDKDIGPEFEQKTVDFDNIQKFRDVFQGLSTGFCCIGTTSSKSGGREGFIKVDHDYVINTAEVAKSTGCRHFFVVTSYASNKDSRFLYSRTKGQVEEDLKALDFERLTILRPSLLLCDRVESRPIENCFRWCFGHMPQSFQTDAAISTDNLAKVMVFKAKNPSPANVETIENRDMYELLD